MVVSISMGGTRDPLGIPRPPRAHATGGQSARHPTNVRLGVRRWRREAHAGDFFKNATEKNGDFSWDYFMI